MILAVTTRKARNMIIRRQASSSSCIDRSSVHLQRRQQQQQQPQRRCIVIRSTGGGDKGSCNKKSKPTRNSDSSSSTSSTATINSASCGSSSSFFFQHQLQPALTAFCIGTLAGTMGSMAGMGGGFVMIPLMTAAGSSFSLRLTQHQAHGTSLFAVAATGLSGSIAYADQVHYEAALAITATAMLTARWGARATTFLSEKALKQALGVLLLLMGPAVPLKAYTMKELEKDETHETQQSSRTKVDGTTKAKTISSSHLPSMTHANEKHCQDDNNNSQKSKNHDNDKKYTSLLHRTLVPAGIGVGSGFLAGLFGVGGGTLVVPALAIFHADEITTHHQALGTSLAAMTLPAIVGTYTHWSVGNVTMRNGIAPALAIGALLGASVGGKTALQIPESTLQWGFSALLTVLGVRTLWKTK